MMYMFFMCKRIRTYSLFSYRKWYTVVVFLTLAVLTLLLAFAMSIVMSAGIKQSCDTYKDKGGHDS